MAQHIFNGTNNKLKIDIFVYAMESPVQTMILKQKTGMEIDKMINLNTDLLSIQISETK